MLQLDAKMVIEMTVQTSVNPLPTSDFTLKLRKCFLNRILFSFSSDVLHNKTKEFDFIL